MTFTAFPFAESVSAAGEEREREQERVRESAVNFAQLNLLPNQQDLEKGDLLKLCFAAHASRNQEAHMENKITKDDCLKTNKK